MFSVLFPPLRKSISTVIQFQSRGIQIQGFHIAKGTGRNTEFLYPFEDDIDVQDLGFKLDRGKNRWKKIGSDIEDPKVGKMNSSTKLGNSRLKKKRFRATLNRMTQGWTGFASIV